MAVQAIVEKHADGKFPIGLRYTTPDLDTSEKISAVTAVITPTGDGDDLATNGAVSIASDGKSFSWVVEKGRAGYDYTVQFKVTTDAGKIYKHPQRESIIVSIVS